MKKLLIILVCSLLSISMVRAQQDKYLVFEFIKVEKDQLIDFLDFKDLMEKVYRQALSDGQIKGWDFWKVRSGSAEGKFEYIAVTYYGDPVKMMEGISDEKMVEYAKIAYPHMEDSHVKEVFEQSLSMRDLTSRMYMRELSSTNDNFAYKPGVLASFDLMKAVEGRFNAYEKAEIEVFKPIHQDKINQGMMGHWSFLRAALPLGSEANYTHLTVNLYTDYMQFFNSHEYENINQTEEEREAVSKGLNSRDQKWIYMANLENVVR